ncbi:TetR/AcrR family transcriptional regulator [Enterovibrio nigricans]|uniref:DNA-binding transcriptional regulator, AcrR family n=1 Tax=Enterovibrio nigricans DSM 22720 TaxID=1121868 RepID=A0A1T4USB7_9GAMM|nr:TetR-like C-terminal domain-containing protein [Enterovibrio nigricans]PKF51020.1 TetR/AcrR family transcriptional regulator [Enterovibrio nigricans]SKA55540.1 DNA-binding transcriptional regulator, AcrR family [Enterovibrio nigricans DSM 22720]
MARRNDHSREELVELTLTCVEDYLKTQPYHSLSLRKIAAMIGYVPSTLVNVFGSYNILLLHIVARAIDELRSQAAQALSATSEPKTSLSALAHLYLDFAAENRYRWQLIFEHSMQGDKLPDWQNDRIQSMTGLLEALLRKLSPDKSDEDVIQASRVLWAGVHGITLLSVDDKLFTDVPVNGGELIDNLLSGYLSGWVSH